MTYRLVLTHWHYVPPDGPLPDRSEAARFIADAWYRLGFPGEPTDTFDNYVQPRRIIQNIKADPAGLKPRFEIETIDTPEGSPL